MTALLYRWPEAAQVRPRRPKDQVLRARQRLAHGAQATIRRRGPADQLGLQARRAPPSTSAATTRCPRSRSSRSKRRATTSATTVLAAIDKAVQIPIIFEISRETTAGKPNIRMVAAHKQLGDERPRSSAAYFTHRLAARPTRPRAAPAALDLAGLLRALLAPLLPFAARPARNCRRRSTESTASRKLEREIAALERQLRTEPQLNRKVELRRQLRRPSKQISRLRARPLARRRATRLRTPRGEADDALARPDGAEHRQDRRAVPQRRSPRASTMTATRSGAIDFDLLRQELSDHVVEGPQERYQLDWPGKRAALFAANAPDREDAPPGA